MAMIPMLHHPASGYAPQQLLARVEKVNGELLPAHELDHDVAHDAHDLGGVERGVQTVLGDIEVGDRLVLLLELTAELAQRAVLGLELPQTVLELDHLGRHPGIYGRGPGSRLP